MPKQRYPWFRFFPRDWLDETRRLTLEERGALIDMVAIQMAYETPVQDDMRWLAHQLHISERKTRVLIDALTHAKKLVRVAGGLINERAAAEIAARQDVRDVNTESALSRWRDTPGSRRSERLNNRENGEIFEQKQSVDGCDRTANAVPRARAADSESYNTPLPPVDGGPGDGWFGDNTGNVGQRANDRQAEWLAELRAEPRDAAVVEHLLAPLLTERRFSSDAPLDDLRAAASLARGLPGPTLAKAWALLRDATHQGKPLTTIKPGRLREAIGAVRRGGAMFQLRHGTPQWRRWHEHLAATDPTQAGMLQKFDGWIVPSEWPPAAAHGPDSEEAAAAVAACP